MNKSTQKIQMIFKNEVLRKIFEFAIEDDTRGSNTKENTRFLQGCRALQNHSGLFRKILSPGMIFLSGQAKSLNIKQIQKGESNEKDRNSVRVTRS